MLIAADVGGTKTLIGLFARGTPRPAPLATRSLPTGDYAGIGAMLSAFLADVSADAALPRIEAAALGVAGPVVDGRAQLTNVGWALSAREVSAQLGTPRVVLLNDLAAMAASVEVLRADERASLQDGVPDASGPAAVIAAGTGLGQALLPRVDGRLQPLATEAGHADFAARTDREVGLLRFLRERYGRAEVEQVLSGPGLANLHRFTHTGAPCGAGIDADRADAPAAISREGLDGRCAACREALDLFVEAYGAEAGNLALRSLPTAGLFVGGGIAPRILPALREKRFLAAFRAKAPMHDLLARIPVTVILNPDAGLIGAAVVAERLAEA